MKGSTIITTYNRPELVKRALNSALNQTYAKDTEIIVVDDYSYESLTDIASDSRIKYIRHETNRGLSAARNTGVKHASGKYVVFLDDDNELAPEFLEQTIKLIEHPSLTFDAVGVGRTIKYANYED